MVRYSPVRYGDGSGINSIEILYFFNFAVNFNPYHAYSISTGSIQLASPHHTVSHRSEPYVTVLKKKTTLHLPLLFPLFFKHRYEDRHIKRYFLKNNSVTENKPLHLPLP